jgi:hypothetical protein
LYTDFGDEEKKGKGKRCHIHQPGFFREHDDRQALRRKNTASTL